MISVVIPALNAQDWLRDAIDSVLAQDWPDLEVLVVDNSSSDGTAAVARSFGAPVRCLHCATPGQPATSNTGLRAGRGEWFAFLDADDLWARGKLRRQRALFDARPELDAVFGHAMNFRGMAQDIAAGTEAAPAPLPGTMLVRREAFLRVGFFDESFVVGSVLDWYLRAQEAGLRMHMLPELLLYRRLHGHNLGTRSKDQQGDYVRVLKAALDRRRMREAAVNGART